VRKREYDCSIFISTLRIISEIYILDFTNMFILSREFCKSLANFISNIIYFSRNYCFRKSRIFAIALLISTINVVILWVYMLKYQWSYKRAQTSVWAI